MLALIDSTTVCAMLVAVLVVSTETITPGFVITDEAVVIDKAVEVIEESGVTVATEAIAVVPVVDGVGSVVEPVVYVPS